MNLFEKGNRKSKNPKKVKRSVAGDTVRVLSGLVAGVATALLLAPQSGKKTREQLKKNASDLGESVSEKTQEFGKATKEQVNNVKDQVKEKTNL